MPSVIKYIATAGFVICLIIMSLPNHGQKEIRKYYPKFKLLDMQFHYSAATVSDTFDKIGEGGRKAYKQYWLLDFVFIACFLLVQIALTNRISNTTLKNAVIALAALRAVLDVLENSTLLYLISRHPQFNNSLATICSYVTSGKFIALYAWVFGIILGSVIRVK